MSTSSPPGSRLAGRTALVSGAGSGIGRAVVERFLAEGASVVGLDRSPGRLADLAEEQPKRFLAVVGDVRRWEDNVQAVEAACLAFGGLDVFVGNAGIFDANLALTELPPELVEPAAEEIFGVNIIGYLLGARAATEPLRARRGAMIFTVSNAGFHPGAGGGILYTVSKHAAVGIVRQLAYELAPTIRVNGVAPGGTITNIKIASTLQGIAGKSDHFADRAAAEQAISETNPLGIVAQPQDHAGIYALLAGDDALAVTGEVISSDGGLAVRGLQRGN